MNVYVEKTVIFSFFFYFAYVSSGLYQSPSPVTADNTPLPILLSSFRIVPHGISAAELQWVSASEINSHYFRIERSSDALNWVFVDDVSAAGNSSSSISYSYEDQGLSEGREPLTVLYYRLKMVDLDGTYEYSEIRAFNVSANLDEEVSIYPNPAYDEVYFGSEDDINIESIRINDNTGRLIALPILQNSRLDVSYLPPGIYVIEILTDKGISIEQLIIR